MNNLLKVWKQLSGRNSQLHDMEHVENWKFEGRYLWINRNAKIEINRNSLVIFQIPSLFWFIVVRKSESIIKWISNALLETDIQRNILKMQLYVLKFSHEQLKYSNYM